jgi:hypothetical protein
MLQIPNLGYGEHCQLQSRLPVWHTHWQREGRQGDVFHSGPGAAGPEDAATDRHCSRWTDAIYAASDDQDIKKYVKN